MGYTNHDARGAKLDVPDTLSTGEQTTKSNGVRLAGQESGVAALKREVLRHNIFGLRARSLGSDLDNGCDRCSGNVESLCDQLFQKTADACSVGVAVVFQALIRHAFHRDTSASLPFCHVVVVSKTP